MDVQTLVRTLLPVAVDVADRTAVPARLLLGEALAAQRRLGDVPRDVVSGTLSHNPYGVLWEGNGPFVRFKLWRRAHRRWQSRLVRLRLYPDWTNAVEDYARMLRERVASLGKAPRWPEEWVRLLYGDSPRGKEVLQAVQAPELAHLDPEPSLTDVGPGGNGGVDLDGALADEAEPDEEPTVPAVIIAPPVLRVSSVRSVRLSVRDLEAQVIQGGVLVVTSFDVSLSLVGLDHLVHDYPAMLTQADTVPLPGLAPSEDAMAWVEPEFTRADVMAGGDAVRITALLGITVQSDGTRRSVTRILVRQVQVV